MFDVILIFAILGVTALIAFGPTMLVFAVAQRMLITERPVPTIWLTLLTVPLAIAFVFLFFRERFQGLLLGIEFVAVVSFVAAFPVVTIWWLIQRLTSRTGLPESEIDVSVEQSVD